MSDKEMLRFLVELHSQLHKIAALLDNLRIFVGREIDSIGKRREEKGKRVREEGRRRLSEDS